MILMGIEFEPAESDLHGCCTSNLPAQFCLRSNYSAPIEHRHPQVPRTALHQCSSTLQMAAPIALCAHHLTSRLANVATRAAQTDFTHPSRMNSPMNAWTT